MHHKMLLAAATTAVGLATVAPASQAAPCLGLECGQSAVSIAAPGPLPSVAPRDLEKSKSSGFYDFGTPSAGLRATAYVATPGTWAKAPAAIRAIADAGLTVEDRASKTIVVYGSGVVVTVPSTLAVAARKRKSPTARAAAASDCPGGYFCIWDYTSFNGGRAQFASTGYWYSLSSYGWQGRASSMYNRRNGWTLLERSSSARYCAVPNSQDSRLANNGYDNNTSRVFLSTSTSKSSAWSCTN